MPRSFIARFLRSFYESIISHEKTQNAATEIAYYAIKVFGWKAIASALGRYAEEHEEQSFVYYVGNPDPDQVSGNGTQ